LIIAGHAQNQTLLKMVALEHFEEQVINDSLGWIIQKAVYLHAEIQSCARAKLIFLFVAR